MNYVFKSNEEVQEFFMSEYKLEYLEVDNEIQEQQNSVAIQFDDFKLPSYGLPSIDDEYMLCSKFTKNKNLEKNDMLSSSNLKSTWVLNDSSCNYLDAKNTNSNNELDNCSVHCIDGNAKEEYFKNHLLENICLLHLDNKEEQELTPKTICLQKNSSEVIFDQNRHFLIGKAVNHQSSEDLGIKRWGRKQDVQTFKALRELSNREGVSLETFFDEESSLTEKHHFILFELVYKYSWKRNTQTMLKRIRSLSKNQEMSVRERRQFERLRKDAKKKNKPFIIEEIAHFFPGKLVSTLRACINP